jgi:taurine dioxygenase
MRGSRVEDSSGEAMSTSDFTVEPMPVGAEIVGLRPGREADPAVQRDLYAAWLEHGILLFRGVDSVERHLAISRCFGELEAHPVPEVRHPENEFLIEIGGRMRTPAYLFDDKDVRINRIAFHRDTAFSPDICKGAMLRMLEVPTVEGETLLADTAMAWDDLPAELQRKLEGLEYKATLNTDPPSVQGRPGAIWKTARLAEDNAEETGRRSLGQGIDVRYPSVVHPAMVTHPESGRKCIFLSPTYIDQFLGLPQAESDALLRRLTDHMLQPKYVYRHKWSQNDAIVWDNRRFMHAGMGNLPDEPRYAHRTTLAGPMRTGRYFDEAAKRPETAIVD